MVWVWMPIRSSSSSIFNAVVVLPEPEGPESRMMWDSLRWSAIFRAADRTFSAKAASHASAKPLGSERTASLISFRE